MLEYLRADISEQNTTQDQRMSTTEMKYSQFITTLFQPILMCSVELTLIGTFIVDLFVQSIPIG